MNYGIPYQGSKSKILKHLGPLFPSAKHFYDVFGGGFAVTHWLLLNRPNDFETFHFNEPRAGVVDLIQRAIAGEFSYEINRPKWISRDEFLATKDTDGYIKMCWSFGNNGRDYLYGKPIEPYKRSCHQAIVLEEFNEISIAAIGLNAWPDELCDIRSRRLRLRHNIEKHRLANTLPKILHQFLPSKQLASLQHLLQLERIGQLQRMEHMERCERIEHLGLFKKVACTASDYRELKYQSDAVLYCDPPYRSTAKYDEPFEHDAFESWAATHELPVLVSEYTIKHPLLTQVAAWSTTSSMSANGLGSKAVERLYGNRAALELMRQPKIDRLPSGEMQLALNLA